MQENKVWWGWPLLFWCIFCHLDRLVATSFVDVKLITNGDWLTRSMTTIEVIADIDMCLSIVVFFLFRLVWDAFLCICIVKRLNISFVIRTTYCKYNHATKLVCLVRWRRRRISCSRNLFSEFSIRKYLCSSESVQKEFIVKKSSCYWYSARMNSLDRIELVYISIDHQWKRWSGKFLALTHFTRTSYELRNQLFVRDFQIKCSSSSICLTTTIWLSRKNSIAKSTFEDRHNAQSKIYSFLHRTWSAIHRWAERNLKFLLMFLFSLILLHKLIRFELLEMFCRRIIFHWMTEYLSIISEKENQDRMLLCNLISMK